MSYLRLAILLPVVPMLMAADQCSSHCCVFPDDHQNWIMNDRCEGAGGTVDYSIDDKDECLIKITEGATCADFCAAAEEACPGDTACEHSCEDAPVLLNDDDLDCAENSSSCADIAICWGGLYPSDG